MDCNNHGRRRLGWLKRGWFSSLPGWLNGGWFSSQTALKVHFRRRKGAVDAHDLGKWYPPPLCTMCGPSLSLSCPAALCGWNWWLAWPSLRLLRLCVQLFQVSVMLLCVCLQKWVSLDEGWCWNHSSSYNTMPRLTRFGGPRFWGSLPGNKSVEIPRLWDTGAFRAGPGCRKNYGSYSIALPEISFTSSRFHICVPTWLQILLQIIHAVADLTP